MKVYVNALEFYTKNELNYRTYKQLLKDLDIKEVTLKGQGKSKFITEEDSLLILERIDKEDEWPGLFFDKFIVTHSSSDLLKVKYKECQDCKSEEQLMTNQELQQLIKIKLKKNGTKETN